MILKIKIPTHLGVYKMNKKTRFRAALNLVRQRRKIYDLLGIKIDRVFLIDGNTGQMQGKLV